MGMKSTRRGFLRGSLGAAAVGAGCAHDEGVRSEAATGSGSTASPSPVAELDVQTTVNGKAVTVKAGADTTALEAVREQLDLTGCKPGLSFCKGAVIFLPCFTFVYTRFQSPVNMRLPEISPVIISVSSIGTPALMSCPIVCSERLMYSDLNMFFMTGIESLALSIQNRPTSVLANSQNPSTSAEHAAEDERPTGCIMNWLSAMRNVVAHGSTSSLPSNTA